MKTIIKATASTTVYQWFVEPLDDLTNSMIARYLADQNQAGDDHQAVTILDKENRPHSVWQVEYNVITLLSNSTRQVVLHFRVFNRAGGRGPIRPWKFGRKTTRVC